MSIYLTFIAGSALYFTRKHQCVCNFSVGGNLIFFIVHRHVGDNRTVKATFRTSELGGMGAAPVEKSFHKLDYFVRLVRVRGRSMQIF